VPFCSYGWIIIYRVYGAEKKAEQGMGFFNIHCAEFENNNFMLISYQAMKDVKIICKFLEISCVMY